VNEQIAAVFKMFLTVLVFCVIGRSLLTWFPISRDNPAVRILNQVTEPLLAPVRNILPRNGTIDFSGMIVIVVLYVMIAVVDGVAKQ